MNEQSNYMVERNAFVFPDQIDGDFDDIELEEDMEGVTLRLPRAKIPGGGTLQFEVSSDNPDEPDYERCLEGVLMYAHLSNAYWPEGSEYAEDTPPLCQSVDGKLGIGAPGGMCADCMLNQFGSGSNGTGKACKNMRMVYLLRDGEQLPIQLSLPPTSLRGYNDYVSAAFLNRRRGICSGITQITLKKMVSNGGKDYSVAVFKKLRDFTGEELAVAKAVSAGFRTQIKEMNARRAENHAAQAEEVCEYQSGATALPDNDDHFAVEVIDGERDELPA